MSSWGTLKDRMSNKSPNGPSLMILCFSGDICFPISASLFELNLDLKPHRLPFFLIFFLAFLLPSFSPELPATSTKKEKRQVNETMKPYHQKLGTNIHEHLKNSDKPTNSGMLGYAAERV